MGANSNPRMLDVVRGDMSSRTHAVTIAFKDVSSTIRAEMARYGLTPQDEHPGFTDGSGI
jgi:hypothetical protein